MHHLELQARRIEDVLVVGQPQLLASIPQRGIGFVCAGALLQLLAVPGDAERRGQDGPAHLREPACEKRRHRQHDVVLRLEPRHVQRSGAGVLDERVVVHRPKAHKRLHLVHVAAHRLGQMLRAQDVGIHRVAAQRGLVHQPPQQAVQQAKTVRIAVQHHTLAQRDELRRHMKGRVAGLAWCLLLLLRPRLRVGGRRCSRLVRAGKQVRQCRIGAVPAHVGRLNALGQQAPRVSPKTRPVRGAGQHRHLQLRLHAGPHLHIAIHRASRPGPRCRQRQNRCGLQCVGQR